MSSALLSRIRFTQFAQLYEALCFCQFLHASNAATIPTTIPMDSNKAIIIAAIATKISAAVIEVRRL